MFVFRSMRPGTRAVVFMALSGAVPSKNNYEKSMRMVEENPVVPDLHLDLSGDNFDPEAHDHKMSWREGRTYNLILGMERDLARCFEQSDAQLTPEWLRIFISKLKSSHLCQIRLCPCP